MKAPDAFRTISEVAESLDLPQHVLRFWETRFTQIKPLKRGGGRRYYRPEDVDLLRGIRLLLYSEGFTIRGVQRLLKERGIGFVVSVGQTGSVQTVTRAEPPAPSAPSPAEPDEPVPTADWQPAFQAPFDEPEATVDGAALPIQAVVGREFSREVRRALEAALGELVEAKRILDKAATPPA